MSRTFYITTTTRQQRISVLQMAGDDETLTIDFSAWAEDNAELTSSTWAVQSGSAAVDGQDLTTNVATARITTASSGKSNIKLSATDGTHTKTVYIRIVAKDPSEPLAVSDYGLMANG